MASSSRALYVPAEVLGLSGLTLTARLVLAEVIDLYKVGGRVFAGDDHFADRFGCSDRSVRTAITDLEDAGHLEKDLNYARRQKRLLVPTDLWKNFPLLPEESSTSPVQEVPEESSTTSGNNFQDFRKILPIVPENSSNINTTINTTLNSTLNSTPVTAVDEEKKEEDVEAEEPVVVEVVEPMSTDPPPKEKVAAKRKGPAKPARTVRTAKPDVPFLKSEIGTLEAFIAAFEHTDYALANLPYYFEQVATWRDRKTGEPPLRKDWEATAKRFFLNDISSNSLVLAPGAQQYSGGSASPDTGARASGYRSQRYGS
jgi:hypothetical protein